MTDQQRPTLCPRCGGHIDRCGCTPLSEINAALLRRKREADLAELLEHARAHPPSEEELRAQRRSYVRAEAGFGSDADEVAYQLAHQRGDTAEMARLDAAADERMRLADAYMDATYGPGEAERKEAEE